MLHQLSKYPFLWRNWSSLFSINMCLSNLRFVLPSVRLSLFCLSWNWQISFVYRNVRYLSCLYRHKQLWTLDCSFISSTLSCVQDVLIPSLLSKGIEFSAHSIEMIPGTPILPMLARYICFLFAYLLFLCYSCPC